jgi:uncharacterized protein YceK
MNTNKASVKSALIAIGLALTLSGCATVQSAYDSTTDTVKSAYDKTVDTVSGWFKSEEEKK